MNKHVNKEMERNAEQTNPTAIVPEGEVSWEA